MIVISIDPGETIGLCRWEDSGELLFKGKLDVEEFMAYLSSDWTGIDVLAVVMEDYLLRQGKQLAQTGSRMTTSQVIGMARLFARQKGAKFHLQNPEAYKLAAMHAGIKLPHGHIADDLSAELHGRYFFESIGVLKPVSHALY